MTIDYQSIIEQLVSVAFLVRMFRAEMTRQRTINERQTSVLEKLAEVVTGFVSLRETEPPPALAKAQDELHTALVELHAPIRTSELH